jgi:hypothetical protein
MHVASKAAIEKVPKLIREMIAVQEKFMMKRLARDCGPSFTVAQALIDHRSACRIPSLINPLRAVTCPEPTDVLRRRSV